MNARLTLAAATLAFMAAGLLRPGVLLNAQQPPATPPVPADLVSLETYLTDAKASNRNQKTRGDTNIFIARWKP